MLEINNFNSIKNHTYEGVFINSMIDMKDRYIIWMSFGSNDKYALAILKSKSKDWYDTLFYSQTLGRTYTNGGLSASQLETPKELFKVIRTTIEKLKEYPESAKWVDGDTTLG